MKDAGDSRITPTSGDRDATVQAHGVRYCLTFISARADLSHRPRVILVEDYGSLVGLVTVKDVLQLKPSEWLHSPSMSWSARDGFGGVLEEVWAYFSNVRDFITSRYRLFRR